MRENEKIVAVDFLVDLFMSFVFHIIWIFRRDTIDNDLLVKLNSKSIFVDGNLFDIISASDLHSSFRDKMLDDNISHKFSVGVSFLI